MTSLTSVLPAPANRGLVDELGEDDGGGQEEERVIPTRVERRVPPYGQRKGFVPRRPEDFGDGGAFPEVHVAQYPLDMGRKRGQSASRTVELTVDGDGKVNYDAIVATGSQQAHIFARHGDIVEKRATDDVLLRPDEETERQTTEDTRAALERIVSGKIRASHPKNVATATSDDAPTYVRYTPSQQGTGANSGASSRVIRLVEMPKDPFEPPKFEHKRVPRAPPSPPVPIMHSPPRKVTAKDQADWKIPPCVSNWKNPKGFTIPLDKRLAADGRALQEVTINDNFAKLAESLYIAERDAREELNARAQIQKKIALKEKEVKEEELRKLAQKARMERAGLVPPRPREGEAPSAAPPKAHDTRAAEFMGSDEEEEGGGEEEPYDSKARERDTIREERRRERERERRLEAAGPAKRSKITRDRDRDISEKIALGQAVGQRQSGEVQFDTRLFNQSEGMDSGFGAEDGYTVYDKPLFQEGGVAQIYRPRKTEEDAYAEDGDAQLEKLTKTSRFVPDKDFTGVDRSKKQAPRQEPVQFEREPEADPFGLDEFLSEAKKAKSVMDKIGGKRSMV